MILTTFNSLKVRTSTLLLPTSLFVIAIGTILSVWLNATIFMTLATISYFTLTAGLILRERRRTHVLLMNTAILFDLILVGTLEIQRNAIDTAVSMSLSPLQQTHILFSTLATILYFPTLYLGWMRYLKPQSRNATRVWHLRIGIMAYIFRTLGFFFMFSILSYIKNS